MRLPARTVRQVRSISPNIESTPLLGRFRENCQMRSHGRFCLLRADKYSSRFVRTARTRIMPPIARRVLLQASIASVRRAAGASAWLGASRSGGRTLPLRTVPEREARGIAFCSLTETLDTTSAGGRLVFHIFGRSLNH
jgi:hypothetical protein